MPVSCKRWCSTVIAATAELKGVARRSGLRADIGAARTIGDPVLRACGDALTQAPHLRSIVYLSTVGVYGDHGGGWVDEATPPQPDSTRGRQRLAAEQGWQELGARHGIAVAILRLAGIYGPGRNALIQIARGKARRIVKPGQIFNRIHVGDIAQAIDAAFTRKASGIFNVADDEPSPPGDPISSRRSSRPAAAGNPLRRSRAVDVADGVEFLAGVPACEQRQAQARARRGVALSDLSRGIEGVVRGAVRIYPLIPAKAGIEFWVPAFAGTSGGSLQCKLGPLRKRLRSLDLTRKSMVSPSR